MSSPNLWVEPAGQIFFFLFQRLVNSRNQWNLAGRNKSSTKMIQSESHTHTKHDEGEAHSVQYGSDPFDGIGSQQTQQAPERHPRRKRS